MPAAWTVAFYEDDDGCPVREFLDGLDRDRRAKLLALIRLLEEQGPTAAVSVLESGSRKAA